MAKNRTKFFFQTLQFSTAILHHPQAEIDYSSFILLYTKFQVNLTKIEGVMAIFVIYVLRYERGG